MKPENTKMVQDKKEDQNLLETSKNLGWYVNNSALNLTYGWQGQCREENMYHAIHIVW